MSEWSEIATRGLLFQCANTKNPTKIHHRHHLIKCNLFWPRYTQKSVYVRVKQQSLTHSTFSKMSQN
jgi:hypothetical protein